MSAQKIIGHRAYLAGNLPAYACDRVGRQTEVTFAPGGRSSQPGGKFASDTLDTPSNKREAIRWN